MLSDEEKKAIEYLKENLKNWKDTRPSLSNTDIVEEVDKDYKAIETLLTAYEKEKEKAEKQSKEIEELKEKNRQGKMRIVQLENEITARIEDVNKYYTSNDKIKATIEELQEDIKYSGNPLSIDNFKFGIKVLQSLLEKE